MSNLFCFSVYILSGFYVGDAFLHHAAPSNRHLNATMNILIPLLRSATWVAETSQPPKPPGESIFDTQGHIYDVIDEVRYYSQLMTLPNISVVCETGFNAGHSAITFLASNPNIHLYSFDLGDMPWTAKSVELVNFLFPGRFTYIKGKSTETITDSVLPPGVKCDLFSVDGDHSNSYADYRLGPKICRPQAYVLADDFSSSGVLVIRDWRRAEREKLIKTIDCHPDAFWMDKVGGYFKGWCLGQYTN